MSTAHGPCEPARLLVGSADGARTHHREAVRALVVDGDGRYLLLAEARSPGLKFPGGGVLPGEGDEHGARPGAARGDGVRARRRSGALAVVVDERRPGIEPDVVLAMQSRYYRVTLGRPGATALEDDEVALGLEAVRLPLDEALRRQREHVEDDPQPWAHRELAVLELLASTDDQRLARRQPVGSQPLRRAEQPRLLDQLDQLVDRHVVELRRGRRRTRRSAAW